MGSAALGLSSLTFSCSAPDGELAAHATTTYALL
jgi:hypothetical protein